MSEKSPIGKGQQVVSNLAGKVGLVTDIPLKDQIDSRIKDLDEHLHHNPNVDNGPSKAQFFTDPQAKSFWPDVVPTLFTQSAEKSGAKPTDGDHALVKYGKTQPPVSDSVKDIPFDMAWAQVREAFEDSFTLNPRETNLLGNFLTAAAPVLGADPNNKAAFEVFADVLRKAYPDNKAVVAGVAAVEQAFLKSQNAQAWINKP
jgi:hypothetical protein